jgi:hypothetical protein
MPEKLKRTRAPNQRSLAFIGIILVLLAIGWIILKPSPKPKTQSTTRSLPKVCSQPYQNTKSGVLTKIDRASKLIIVTDITGADFGSPGYFYYTDMPKVFDKQCAAVSLGTLQPEQHLIVYYTDSQHFFIQTEQ